MRIIRLSTAARSELISLLERTSLLSLLEHWERQGAQSAVYAGAVRDVLVYTSRGFPKSIPRDFDIGVKGIACSEFDGLMRELGGERNRYGGYRAKLNDSFSVDFWRLEDTIGLRYTRAKCTVENVLRSFVLNCNAVAFDPLREQCFDLESINSVQQGQIDIVDKALIHSHSTFAAKAATLRCRLGFRLSDSAKKLIQAFCTRTSLAHETDKIWPGFHIDRHWTSLIYGSSGLDNEDWYVPDASTPSMDRFSTSQPQRIDNSFLERSQSSCSDS